MRSTRESGAGAKASTYLSGVCDVWHIAHAATSCNFASFPARTEQPMCRPARPVWQFDCTIRARWQAILRCSSEPDLRIPRREVPRRGNADPLERHVGARLFLHRRQQPHACGPRRGEGCVEQRAGILPVRLAGRGWIAHGALQPRPRRLRRACRQGRAAPRSRLRRRHSAHRGHADVQRHAASRRGARVSPAWARSHERFHAGRRKRSAISRPIAPPTSSTSVTWWN